jgi:hypothetical protein
VEIDWWVFSPARSGRDIKVLLRIAARRVQNSQPKVVSILRCHCPINLEIHSSRSLGAGVAYFHNFSSALS